MAICIVVEVSKWAFIQTRRRNELMNIIYELCLEEHFLNLQTWQ